MAIYHLNVRGVSRARGSSSVRSAAYQSGERIVDERTGELCDYRRKERIVASGIELPDGAPPALSSRPTLWNAMERCVEGTALSARRIEFALPRELDSGEREDAVLAMAATFTSRGHAVDWAIHDAGDGNPHAHMLVTGLPLSMSWDGSRPEAAFERPSRPRTVKCYLLRSASGEERFFPSGEWKSAKADGWAKVYRYRVGASEERLTQVQAAARGLSNEDRASKQPVSKAMRVGGGSDFEATKDELRSLRADWARIANSSLAAHAGRVGGKAASIDHRSNAARGIEAEPTIHEGPNPSRERVETNARIRALNEAIARAVAELRKLADRAARVASIARQNGRRRALALRSKTQGRTLGQIDRGGEMTPAERAAAAIAAARAADARSDYGTSHRNRR